jgi:exosortase
MSMKGTDAGKLRAKRPIPKKGSAADAPKPEASEVQAGPKFDAQAIMRSPAFLPGVLAFVGLVLMFWRMVSFLPDLWMGKDGYYSHGFLVPFITGYVIYKAWPRIKDREVVPQYWAGFLLLIFTYCALVTSVTGMQSAASATFVLMLLASILFVAGWQWFKALALPTIYLLFALPVWSMVIDNYTNPMQIASTKVAYKMLEIAGLQPLSPNDNTIYLNNFTLDVGVPCSGLKLVVALGAFTIFFVLIARLRWWANLFMLVVMWPLALLINGLRIAMIGVVGNQWGAEAGGKFHDYSGYITLVLCFFILFKIARGLGWKD